MAQDYFDIPPFLTTREGEAASSNWSVTDYGREGDLRPYQVVLPSYPAPQFLQTYNNLKQALRECDTLCQLKGKPFRLVKWGARLPCYPCRGSKKTNMLPQGRVLRRKAMFSPGALDGYPDATPVAEFRPTGSNIVYGPDGQPKMVGAPNFRVARTPFPPAAEQHWPTLPQTYLQAVKSAQYLANAQGKQAYICSGFGANCKGRNSKKWIPMVYVEPGGLVRRYQTGEPLGNASSVRGSTTIITGVTPPEFRELVRESEGGTFLPQGY